MPSPSLHNPSCACYLLLVLCLFFLLSFLKGELLAFLVFIPSSLSMVEGGGRVAVFSAGFDIKLVMLNCCFFLFSFSRMFSIFVGRGACNVGSLSTICFCQAQPQLQLNLWLRLVLFLE